MRLLKQIQTSLDTFASHIYSSWGETYVTRGQIQEAIKACTRSIKLNPYEVDAYQQRGIAYTQDGNYAQAIEDFDAAIRLSAHPKITAEIYARRGMAYYYAGEFADAVADYNLAVYYLPHHSMMYMYRGMAELAQGNHQAALHDFNRALKEDARNYMAYRHRGDTHVSQGNLKQAISDYWRFIEIGTIHNASGIAEIREKINTLRGALATA